jgi:O-antigen ligase
MRLLLSLLMLSLMISQTFSLDPSLGPGLSLKNALVYAAAVTLAVRMVLSGRFRLEMAGVQACFAFLVAYAAISFLVAIFAVQYPGYDIVGSGISLKNALVDHAIFFAVFFYGARSLEDSVAVTDVMLMGVVVANVITVLDASGVLGWNIIPVRTESVLEVGRVQGAFGESNQHAAVVVLLLPAMLAKALLSRGPWRVFWAGGAVFAVAALLMTVSRGAMLGIVLASIWGAYVFRRFLSLGKLAGWFTGAVAVVAVVILGLSANYTELLADRVLGITFSVDATDATSGRTLIWQTALARMVESPWSFFTGFGWNVYSSMGFEFAPHNTYLGYWFNLGLPGLLAFVLIIALVLFAARSAADYASTSVRPYLLAFVVGFMALAISIFFVELHEPWLYVWAYVGLSMRMAVAVREQARASKGQASAAGTDAAAGPGRAVPVGWTGRAARRSAGQMAHRSAR